MRPVRRRSQRTSNGYTSFNFSLPIRPMASSYLSRIALMDKFASLWGSVFFGGTFSDQKLKLKNLFDQIQRKAALKRVTLLVEIDCYAFPPPPHFPCTPEVVTKLGSFHS